MGNSGKRYSTEFKQRLVALYNEERRSIAALSREYGVTGPIISKWIKDSEIVSIDNGIPITKKELRKL